jgi:mannose-6-phosphate isomerase-like protein (cupin superfamily)
MKLAFTVIALCITTSLFAQKIQSVDDIKPTEEYENIHVHKFCTDEHASTFIIWVKDNVPLHKHATHSEMVYVLKGAGEFTLGDKVQKIGPGDIINIPTGTPHAVKVTSKKPMKVISVQAPEFLGQDRIPVKKD